MLRDGPSTSLSSNFYIFTRVLEAYPKSIANEYFSITKEIHQWLKQNKKLTE